MAGRRLVLVNPANPLRAGVAVNRASRFPPLSLGLVAALTPATWDVTLIDENWGPFAYREADLAGITAVTPTANRAYQIAAQYRERGVPVVMGGIHPSVCTEEALRFADTVVVGEAERAWPRVVADFEAGQLQRVYQGDWADLKGTPWPRRDLFHPGYLIATVQTSRGCPMDCEFCSVKAFNGGRHRRRPPEEVLEELETIPQKLLFFVDDNLIGFGKRSRDQALALFQGMVEHKLNKWWFCQASLNFADDEQVLHWAGRAGCKMVLLGLEAEKAEALADVNKRLNLNRGVAAYAEAFRRIQRAGIAVIGAFVFGMDSDTPERLRQRAEYIIRSRVDAMVAQILTPLPETRLFERYQQQGRLLYTDFPGDWEHYDMAEVVHRPCHMEPEVLAREFGALNKRLYARPTLARRAVQTLWRTRDAIAASLAWAVNTYWITASQWAQHRRDGRRTAIETALDLWYNRNAARRSSSKSHRCGQ
jgi:radical SAM superfamily enzyme YgiQ (UPF0313 family)